MKNKLIENFLQSYTEDIDFYTTAASLCAFIIENALESGGVRSIVSSRAKRPDRLRDKLIKRNYFRQYKNEEEIYDDISDLAGVRIALYFPGDIDEVDTFIKSTFDVVETKDFPRESSLTVRSSVVYKKLFSGYRAKHYRVKLKTEQCEANEQDTAYCNTIVEVQVASVLMHAWAEVEHDLIYKPMSGRISRAEHLILDELNGLVLSGEIALERLQHAVKERVSKQKESFLNHYELSAYLYEYFKQKVKEEPNIGRADLLFSLISKVGMDKPEDLERFTYKVVCDRKRMDISSQLIDLILDEHPTYHDVFITSKVEIDFKNPHRDTLFKDKISHTYYNIISFIKYFVAFEELFIKLESKLNKATVHDKPFLVENYQHLLPKEGDKENLQSVFDIRHELVHSFRIPNDYRLSWGSQALKDMMDSMLVRLEQNEIEEVLSFFKKYPLQSV